MQEIFGFIKLLATSNTVNFIIMLGLLFYVVKKANLAAALENSVSAVEEKIKESGDKKHSAQKHLNQAKVMMDKLPQDLKDLDKNVSEKIDIYAQKVKSDTDNTLGKLSKSTERVIQIEEQKLSNMLMKSVSENSVERAKNTLTDMLSANPKLHDKFIQNSIDELDKVVL